MSSPYCYAHAAVVCCLYEELSGFVARIPASFWGIVVGALFTLGGIHLTNRSHDRRLKLDLDNQRLLQDRALEMAFRKEIYGDAAAAITKAMNTVGRLTDLSIPREELAASYNQEAPTLAKVHLVAKEPTLRAFVALETELAKAFLDLTTKRLPLLLLQEQLKQIDAAMSRSLRTQEALVELMRHENIEGINDSRKFQVIEKNFNYESDQSKMRVTTREKLWSELQMRQLSFVNECFAQLSHVAQFMPPVLVKAREELGLSINIDSYAEIVIQAQQENEANLTNALKQVSEWADSLKASA